MKKYITAAAVLLISICFSSCIGVSADISLNADNSGTVVLEYRLSRLLESIGKLDGNESRLPVPVGKPDFERSVARIKGMKLLSFSSETDEKDITVRAKLEFSDMEALIGFLDPSGEKAAYEKTAGSAAQNNLSIVLGLGENSVTPDSSLAELFGRVSEGYLVNISLNLPVEGKLEGPALPGAAVSAAGKKLSFSMPVSAVLSSPERIAFRFNW